MSSVVYHHKVPPSIESRIIQFFIGLFGMKRSMERRVDKNSYNKKPASLPKSIIKKYNIEVENIGERKVWTISPRQSGNKNLILYLHGGAFCANITKMHWSFVEQLLSATNATLVIPDYPLAPESSCTDTYRYLDTIYENLIRNNPDKEIVFMGDSAGSGLALGFAVKIKIEDIKQPKQIILFSPWLDVSMTNPEIVNFDPGDKILNVNGLKKAGKNYAGDLDVTDYRVSPIYGDLSNLGKISVFIGTKEVFIADARKLMQLLKGQNIGFNYFEYQGMFHDWVLVSNLREARDVINKIANFL